jgi:hypothetical protein
MFNCVAFKYIVKSTSTDSKNYDTYVVYICVILSTPGLEHSYLNHLLNKIQQQQQQNRCKICGSNKKITNRIQELCLRFVYSIYIYIYIYRMERRSTVILL